MGQRIHRVTIERLRKIKALLPGMFVDISATGSRQRVRTILRKAQTVGFVRMPELNIPPERVYRHFACRDRFYIARVK